MTIEIVDYDPSWPERAEREIVRIRTLLPGVLNAVEHFGSTSVPGLAAKPVIDLMASVDALALVSARDAELAAAGLRFVDAGMPERLFYQDVDRGLNFHVVTADSWENRKERLFRDHLRAHPEDAAAYAEVKRRLAATTDDVARYTRGKTELIQRVMDEARAARGLPPVPVWEE
ncbi:GrpB domain, predicted nucleotidyltransferase, UPF0157 family [Streptomyces zhaozhouensis]|uniref:GrpB domain, predicted nucleotidyltransferase, UPF0157 family n=1 Tax=Streptomyces zhaozhouensis TaxID=1300267 RepID=A0A286DY79_9ACTN|nr:GrpB family protein [Streptomyces zhaozhouensis]SOD63619.1 GrpB domain, predicted nucleotidyltransferase, UPF0157 family [Streptomyces zhaozhouensis]